MKNLIKVSETQYWVTKILFILFLFPLLNGQSFAFEFPSWERVNFPVFKEEDCFPTNLVAADMNADGFPDLAVTGFCNRFAVFMSNPANPGRFFPPKEIRVPTSAIGIAVLERQKDPFPLIVVSNCANPDSIPQKPLLHIVSMGNGTVVETLPSGGKAPDDISVADFNQDGIQDLAVGHWKEGVLSILLGKPGHTGFHVPNRTSPQTIEVGDEHWQVESQDMNNDGNLDIVSVLWSFKKGGQKSSDLIILPGDGKGAFKTASVKSFPVDLETRSFTLADFDKNGFVDVAVAHPGNLNKEDGNISFLFGNKDWKFDRRFLVPLVSKDPARKETRGRGLLAPQGIASADLNNDGAVDIVTAGRPLNRNGQIAIYYNDGKGGFSPSRSQILILGPKDKVSSLSFEPLILADFNNDEKTDIAVANTDANTVSVFFNTPERREKKQ